MANETPEVVQIPVKKHEINLSIQDILTPLTVFAQQTHVAQALASSPEAQQHARELAGLARQILDVAGRLNAVAPHLLASGTQGSQGD